MFELDNVVSNGGESDNGDFNGSATVILAALDPLPNGSGANVDQVDIAYLRDFDSVDTASNGPVPPLSSTRARISLIASPIGHA